MAKQGFFNRLIMGRDNMPDFTPEQLPKSRWALFFDLFKNRLFSLFKLSLLCDLFALPLIAIIIFNIVNTSTYNIVVPFDGNLGFGYPIEPNIVQTSNMVILGNTVRVYGIMIIGIALFAIGLAGAFYVMRRIVWGEPVEISRHFFLGIKQNFKPFIVIGLVIGLSLFMMAFSFTVFSVISMSAVLAIILQIISVVQFVITCIMAFYVATQSVTYKLGFMDLIKNSLIFTVALIPQNLFFLAIALAPILLAMILPIILAPAIYFFYLLIGFAYTLLVMTIFAHYVFDKYLNDRVKGAKKNRGMYVPDAEELKRKQMERIKSHNTVYGEAYVAKKLSSIDSGSTLTPLSPSYSRADIAKLTEEKQVIEQEIRKEREVANEEARKELEQYELEQARKNQKGKKKKK